MKLPLRLAAFTFASLLLGACNRVHTDQPLFSAADAKGERLKPGVWRVEDAACAVNEAAPADRWPECAKWRSVREFDILAFERGKDTVAGAWTSLPFGLAAGDPVILQLKIESKPSEVNWVYEAVRVTARDKDGAIIAYDGWGVLCGPPPPSPAPAGKPAHNGTSEPVAGMVMDPDGDNCTTSDPEAVRRSAVLSRDWDKERAAYRWVRAGIR